MKKYPTSSCDPPKPSIVEVGGSGQAFEVYWKNDGQYLYMVMRAKTSGWSALGFEGSEWMKDAEIVSVHVCDRNVTRRLLKLTVYSISSLHPFI